MFHLHTKQPVTDPQIYVSGQTYLTDHNFTLPAALGSNFSVRCVGYGKLKFTGVTLAICLLGKLLASVSLVCISKWDRDAGSSLNFLMRFPIFIFLMVYDRKILHPVFCRPITFSFKCHLKRTFNSKLSCLAPYMVRRSSSGSLAHINYINARCLNQNCFTQNDSLPARIT